MRGFISSLSSLHATSYLLHGAIGTKEQLIPLANELPGEFIIHPINFSGHGGETIPDAVFSIQLFAEDVVKYMQENAITKADIFGYSMGGYVAMYIAKHHAEKVSRIITLATKFHWDETVAAKEIKMLNANAIQQKLPVFVQQLSNAHSPNDWKKILEKTAELLTALGSANTLQPADYTTIPVPCLILLGDRDKMVTLDETVSVYRQLPNAQLGILPNTPHPLELVNPKVLAFIVKHFLLV